MTVCKHSQIGNLFSVWYKSKCGHRSSPQSSVRIVSVILQKKPTIMKFIYFFAAILAMFGMRTEATFCFFFPNAPVCVNWCQDYPNWWSCPPVTTTPAPATTAAPTTTGPPATTTAPVTSGWFRTFSYSNKTCFKCPTILVVSDKTVQMRERRFVDRVYGILVKTIKHLNEMFIWQIVSNSSHPLKVHCFLDIIMCYAPYQTLTGHHPYWVLND